ncbi:MAG: deoxyhypusine synthase family protein, partial [Planctomycetota bacterium]
MDACPPAPPSDPKDDSAGRTLRDGVSDGLEPLETLDLGRVASIDDLVRGMGATAFAARSLGEGADVLEAMVRDPDCFVVCTLSGAMTIAKMGLVLCDMIDGGWIQAIVSTGALMAHGFIEATGRRHFKYDPRFDDAELYERGYDRVYDTLELEQSLDDVEPIVRMVLEGLEPGRPYGSHELHDRLGKWLEENGAGRGILASAHRAGVPVYVPAFTDSELGLDVALHRRRCRREGREPPRHDGFRDLEAYAEQVARAPRIGI